LGVILPAAEGLLITVAKIKQGLNINNG